LRLALWRRQIRRRSAGPRRRLRISLPLHPGYGYYGYGISAPADYL